MIKVILKDEVVLKKIMKSHISYNLKFILEKKPRKAFKVFQKVTNENFIFSN